ncbi:hypothetical protein HanPSC8_Chr01g0019431 [Helianthus annuus]|nr:hypothetical protein HanPSC8_Chr01g0019431 [Helianthus annuus]
MVVREGDKVCAFRCLLMDTIANHLRERWGANQNANAKLERNGTTPPVDLWWLIYQSQKKTKRRAYWGTL